MNELRVVSISVRESRVSILSSLANAFGAFLNPGDSTGAAGGMAVLRGSPCIGAFGGVCLACCILRSCSSRDTP